MANDLIVMRNDSRWNRAGAVEINDGDNGGDGEVGVYTVMVRRQKRADLGLCRLHWMTVTEWKTGELDRSISEAPVCVVNAIVVPGM